jgi:hypothetical protein
MVDKWPPTRYTAQVVEQQLTLIITLKGEGLMKALHLRLANASLLSLLIVSGAFAQPPSVLYTWSHGFGESAGANNEGWAFNFGGNTVALDNATDGTLKVAETGTAGLGWAIIDSFNRIKESANPADFGGIDLTGLDSLQLDLGHTGSNPVNVQVFTHVNMGPSGCCDFVALGPDIAVAPGVATYSVPLSGLTSEQIANMRTIGLNVRDHAADGNLMWTVNEIRSGGTPLTSRVIADHDGGAADFDSAVVDFDRAAVIGNDGGQNQTGLAINAADGSLRWADAAGGPGAAIAYGNGRTGVTAWNFAGRPTDLSNYNFAVIRMRALSTNPADVLDVQYYMNTGANFNYQPFNTTLLADGTFRDLVIPISAMTQRDQVHVHGLNLGTHTNVMDVRIASVIYTVVPEPATVLLVLLAGLSSLRRPARKQG